MHPANVGFISNALNSADIWSLKPHVFCGILEHVEVLFGLAMSVKICLLVKDSGNVELHETRRRKCC